MPVLSPWLLYMVAGLFVTNLLTFFAWRSAEHRVDEYQLRAKVQAEQTQRIKSEQERVTDDTAQSFAVSLNYVRESYERRLRNNQRPVSGVSGSAGGIDATALNPLPPAARVESDCAEETLRLVHLQRWVRQQRNINP